jgi:hypothetical protein
MEFNVHDTDYAAIFLLHVDTTIPFTIDPKFLLVLKVRPAQVSSLHMHFK